jgi:hypothetical protein
MLHDNQQETHHAFGAHKLRARPDAFQTTLHQNGIRQIIPNKILVTL